MTHASHQGDLRSELKPRLARALLNEKEAGGGSFDDLADAVLDCLAYENVSLVQATASNPRVGEDGGPDAEAKRIMDAAWPEYGGNNQSAEFWQAFDEAVGFTLKLIRSGKLVASTGSGKEETKGACLPAPGSCPSGPTASRSSGFAAAIPSRDPAEPCVQWSAWSETDADSDPSDPGVTYCTEWFVGRWPVGAEEPDCRILIGTSRSAEIIARRIAERLTSILNTDRLRSVDTTSPLDTLRPMSEAPTGVPIIAKHKPNAAMPDGWVATIKLGHGDDEAAGCYDTILHYNGEETFRGFRGVWTGWLPMGALAGEARRAETEGLGSRASDGEAGTPDLLSHLRAENANLRDRVREAEGAGRDPDGSGSRPSDQAASHPAPAGFDPSRGGRAS